MAIIKKVDIKKLIVEVSLDNGDKIYISLETYLNTPLLLESEIDQKQINLLKNKDKINLVKVELVNKLSRKRLSVYECREFLKERELTDTQINKIIADLKKNYLINDQELAESIISGCLLQKKGKKKMYEKLIDRKIEGDYIEYINKFIDYSRYNQNILYLINKYKKMANNKSKVQLKNYLYSKMNENGYENDEFTHLLGDFSVEEKSIIIREITKFFKTKERNNENIAKITKKLLSKGFNYDIIKNVIRESGEFETN